MAEEEEEDVLIDITSLIETCAASLGYEDPILAQEESFSLHDTMAALELMDPKMDCCELSAAVVHPKNDPNIIIPPRPIPTCLDDDVSPLPWSELTMNDATEICLVILTRLEALLMGASVAESTFTCLYTHAAVLQDMTDYICAAKEPSFIQQFDNLRLEPKLVSTAQLVVYASTIALVEISDVLRSIVLHGDIYEEEDFSVTTFGLQFFSGGPDAVSTLEETLDRLEEDDQILHAVLSYQLRFLKTCSYMAKLSAGPVKEVTIQVKELVALGVQDLKRLQALLDGTEEPNQILMRCFDPHIYRPLVGSSPVRKVSFREPKDSIPILITILEEVSWSVCDLLLLSSSLIQIRRLLARISVSSVNILSRSLIVLNLYFDDKLLGQYELSDLMGREILQMTNLPDFLLQSKYGKAFLGRLAKPMYDTLKLMVLNRNRQRTYIEAVMFHDWSTLQQEAHMVDMQHRQQMEIPPYFTQYTLFNTVWLMDHHVALGVELQLYTGQHDLSVAYWYRDFLLSSLLNTLSSIRATKKLSRQLEDRTSKKKSNNNVNELKQDDLHDELEILVVGFKRMLCRGIVRFIASLNQAEMIHTEQYEFTSHERRFEKRFEPFNVIVQPPPLTYDDYQSGSDFSNVSQDDLLTSTSDCFKKCKSMLEKISSLVGEVQFPQYTEDEIRGLTKVCVGNSVFLMKLTQLVRDNGKAKGKVSFDFEVNSQYCTIKLS